MLNIKAEKISEAWRKCFIKLYEDGNQLSDSEILKDDTLILEISDPGNSDKYDSFFPMSKNILEEYNQYIIKGGDRGNVKAEHALYHERLFLYPSKENNQIKTIIEKLKKDPFSKSAQASLWIPKIDNNESKKPCLQILWFRIENNKLVMHSHMRANDGYKKLMMNLNVFVEVMRYISNELRVPIGKYIHFVDSFHFYYEDKEEIVKLYNKIKKD